ncbi:LPXTG cell wall anchor domain-containing protein, partial [Limosilactobacillus equigenerosi]|uniref:LPXTG cell wall anchor domain-containing protein n=1 Tax=Limosilactobacillus equigenerosi TaxID=417373 RepID=UPI000AF93436
SASESATASASESAVASASESATASDVTNKQENMKLPKTGYSDGNTLVGIGASLLLASAMLLKKEG